MFLECWPTGKEFRLPWHSFVRVEIYFKCRLSINKKYRLIDSWSFHSEVVRASAWRTRGREFESRTIHFPYQSLYFFISLSFYLSFYFLVLFIRLNIEVKQCAKIYRKYDNTGFVMEQRSCRFIYFYFCSYPTYDKGKIRHIAWLSSFLFKIQCFYQDENDLAPHYQYYIRGKSNTLCFGNIFEDR